MVTIKRETTTEEGRYGGYRTKFNSRMSDYQSYRNTFDYDDLDERDEIDTRYTDTTEEYNTYLWRELNRTSPRRILSPEELCAGVAPSVEPTYRVRESEYAPTYAEPISYIPSRPKVNYKPSLNFRAKALIVVYALVMIAFVALICINAGAISSLNGDIDSLEQTVATETSELNALKSTIATDEEVLNMAIDMGYTQSTTSGTYQLLETVQYSRETVQTNWFDGVCDFLSGVFGG